MFRVTDGSFSFTEISLEKGMIEVDVTVRDDESGETVHFNGMISALRMPPEVKSA